MGSELGACKQLGKTHLLALTRAGTENTTSICLRCRRRFTGLLQKAHYRMRDEKGMEEELEMYYLLLLLLLRPPGHEGVLGCGVVVLLAALPGGES